MSQLLLDRKLRVYPEARTQTNLRCSLRLALSCRWGKLIIGKVAMMSIVRGVVVWLAMRHGRLRGETRLSVHILLRTIVIAHMAFVVRVSLVRQS